MGPLVGPHFDTSLDTPVKVPFWCSLHSPGGRRFRLDTNLIQNDTKTVSKNSLKMSIISPMSLEQLCRGKNSLFNVRASFKEGTTKGKNIFAPGGSPRGQFISLELCRFSRSEHLSQPPAPPISMQNRLGSSFLAHLEPQNEVFRAKSTKQWGLSNVVFHIFFSGCCCLMLYPL